jgi:hypothetical protein
MRHDATPADLVTGPAATPGFLRELARVGEIDLAEGLGPQRLAALSRLAEQSGAAAARRRRRLVTLVSLALALAAALAVALRLG